MLIIYAHPNHDGHCGYILKQFKKHFKKNKTPYQLLDLYKLKYDPVLKQSEHYTSGNYHISTETKEYQELIQKERQFIIIYPTWWNGPPAILKGFFDRTLTSRFAFKYSENGFPTGLLQGKVAVFTTTGGHLLIEKIILRNRSLNVIVKNTLNFCGFKAKGFMLGNATKFTERNKKLIQKKVILGLDYLLK